MILTHSLTSTLAKVDLSWQQTLRTESVRRMTYPFSLRWSFLEGPAHVLLVREYIQEWDTLNLEVQVEVSSQTPGQCLSPSLLPKHLINAWQSDKVNKGKEAIGQASEQGSSLVSRSLTADIFQQSSLWCVISNQFHMLLSEVSPSHRLGLTGWWAGEVSRRKHLASPHLFSSHSTSTLPGPVTRP